MAKKVLALANIVIIGGVLYTNYLASTGQINGISTAEVSGRYPTLFTPIGITFSIWGIIYLLNIAFVVHQTYKAFRLPENYDERLNQGFFFVSITNIMWLIAFHRLAIGFSLFLMLMMLIFLLGTYSRTRHPKYPSEQITENINFSIYLGWISVALISLSAIFITTGDISYQGLAAAVATVVLIAIVVVIALVFVFSERNVWYPLVILWASYGIFAARRTDTAYGASTVKIAAFISMLVIFGSLVYYRIKLSKQNPHAELD